MHDPRVTIVIPVFNGANYLRDAIDSALQQTWPNTEVLVVNDGSQDAGETERIAQSYGDRIAYISKPNGGVASALNAGLRAMTGSIFCWLSHDDRHHPDKTRRQVEEWKNGGMQDEVLFTDYSLIDCFGDTIADVRMDHAMLVSKPLYALLRGAVHGCTVFIPKTLFDRVGFFNESLPTTQDYDLWRRMIDLYPFRHLPEVLIDSRTHEEQTSKKTIHGEEVAKLWVDMIGRTSKELMVSYENSETRFIRKTADFLAANGFDEASFRLSQRASSISKNKLVTVVIPTFNRLPELLIAVESVASQSHRNLELIIVDDGSIDDMSTLSVRLARFPGETKLIRQANAGPAAARNRGWEVARGDYIAFLDSDDVFLPDKISIQVACMEEKGLSFTHTSYFRLFAQNSALEYVPSGSSNYFPELIAGCTIATPTVMIRRSLLDKGLCFPENMQLGEDVCLWISIAEVYGTYGITDPLTIVRSNPSSAAFDREKSQRGVKNILDFVKSHSSLASYNAEIIKLEKLYNALSSSSATE